MITQIKGLETYIKDLLLPRASVGDALTFPKLIEAICKLQEENLRKEIVEYLEKMDRDFRYSKDRVNNYYVKNTRKRTLVTMYGEITYRRTEYINRLNKSKPQNLPHLLFIGIS